MTDPTPGGLPPMIVFDSTAVAAFTRGRIAPGEILAELATESGLVVIPHAALVAAVPAVADRDRLDLLIGHGIVRVATEEPGEWRTLVALVDIVGRLDAAASARLALDLGTTVLTATPLVYAGLGDRLVIEIEDE